MAKVRRCSSFKSPKNPNLSILELFIKDKTGGMKITMFFAGRRSSSIAYVKSQQSLYPVGATVAVRGLVKESKYGKSRFFHGIFDFLTISFLNRYFNRPMYFFGSI